MEQKIEHKWDAERIDKAKEKMPPEKQNKAKITKDDFKRNLKPMPDCKRAGPDKILGFSLKSFTTVHEVLATVLNECIEVGYVPGWLIEGKTILVMKRLKEAY